MDVKYLSDARGNITGVFIPIEEWERLQKQYHIGEQPLADSGKQMRQELASALQKIKRDDSED